MSLLTKAKETFKGIPVQRDREGRPVFDLRDLPNPVKINPIQRDEPPALPTRPAAPPAIEQDLPAAQTALAAIQAAGKEYRDRVLLDPALANPPESFSPGAAKNFLAKWVADVESVLRDAQAGKEISLLQCGDIGRIDRALQGVDRERTGAIEQQRQIVRRMEEQASLDRFGHEYAPTLDKKRRMFVATLLKAAAQYQDYQETAEEARSKCHSVQVSTFPQVPRLSDTITALFRQMRGAKSVDDVLKV